MLALLKPDANGVLKLPLSSSPEVFDNTGRAWLEPNSNYDLMCLKMLFLSLDEMADACGKPDEAKKWAAAAAALGDFHADATGMLLLDAKTPLPYSHRHLSNIIGIYPFNLITCEGSEKDRQRIRASLAQWDKLGTSQWCGYSFSWMSCLRARVGDAESALRNLDIFVKAFILRNGFHANGDQTKSGFSSMTYRPFTLEGNFLAMQAVQEMLLQSWSPTPGNRDTEVIRIFPAMPWRWHDVSFIDLRAEGGHPCLGKAREQCHHMAPHCGRSQWSRADPRQLWRSHAALERRRREESRRELRGNIRVRPSDRGNIAKAGKHSTGPGQPRHAVWQQTRCNGLTIISPRPRKTFCHDSQTLPLLDCDTRMRRVVDRIHRAGCRSCIAERRTGRSRLAPAVVRAVRRGRFGRVFERIDRKRYRRGRDAG